MCVLNIPNKSSWHGDYDKLSYFYKNAIPYGDVGLESCGSGSKFQ